MPAVLIPFIAAALPTWGTVALAGAGAGFGTITWGVATVLAYAVVGGVTALAGYLLSQPKKTKGDPQQVTVKQSIPPRTRSYGQVKVGGAMAFLETGGIGALHQVIIHGEGEWDSILEWWLNDTNALVSGGAVGALPWGSNITLESHLGSSTQTASSILTSTFGGIWTSDHRLRGLAYTVMRMAWVQEKFFSKVYPNGPPSLRVVARTAKVFDPRTNTTAFSENPALCVRDLLTHARAFNIPSGLIDDTSFSAFANTCDEAVSLLAGGTEPRYRVALTYDLTQEPRDVLQQILQSCDGEIYPTADGKVGIRGGKWEAPTVTLTEDYILSYQYDQGNDRLAAFNRLKLTFTHREADYQPVEIDPWEDLASQAGAGVLQQDLTLQQVPSWTQARRLGKIFTAKGNPRHRLVLKTNAAGMLAMGERCVHIHIAELNLDHDFFIEKFEISSDLTGDLTLASLDGSAYDWNPAAEEGTPPTVPANTSTVNTPPEPTGLTLSLVRVQATAGINLVKIRATVDPLTGTNWETIGRYRKVGDTTWIDMADDGDWAVVSDVLDDGGEYEVQAAHAGYGGASGVVGTWTASETISAVADFTPPGDVSGLNAVGTSGSATISWVTPTSPNYFASRLYRNDSPVFGTATQTAELYGSLGQALSQYEPLPAGTFYWWVVTVNRSGIASDPPVGPTTATVG